MGILDEDVARVREATNMVAVVSEHVGLKGVGRRYQGICPFHAEKTPSFSVNPELGLYHSFGCGVGGDAIQLVREIEHHHIATPVERQAAFVKEAGAQARTRAAVEQQRIRLDIEREPVQPPDCRGHAKSELGTGTKTRMRGNGTMDAQQMSGRQPKALGGGGRSGGVQQEVDAGGGQGEAGLRGKRCGQGAAER